jgi:hypothetical protein
MSPRDKDILETLNTLVLLRRSRKMLPGLTELERNVLLVTLEHLDLADISVPTFINTLKELDEKGYLTAISLYEQAFREKLKQDLSEPNYTYALKELEASGVTELTTQDKILIADNYSKKLPVGFEMDRDGFIDTELPFAGLLNQVRNILTNMPSDLLSVIVLMPFRDIEKLLRQMNGGKTFDEVQDSRYWFDATKGKFHIGNESVSTLYQGKPNIEHYVLTQLFSDIQNNGGKLDYVDVGLGNNSRIKSALKRFQGRHPKLKDLFVIYGSYIETNPGLY